MHVVFIEQNKISHLLHVMKKDNRLFSK